MAEETPTIQTELQVMFFDTDCAAVVHNIAYLRFIETARTLLAEKMGMELREMVRTGPCPVVVRTEIDYRRPAILADRLVVHGWLESIERSRFWCAFRIVRPSDGVLIAESRQMLALVMPSAGRAIRLPEEWAVRYAHLKREPGKAGGPGGVPAATAAPFTASAPPTALP